MKERDKHVGARSELKAAIWLSEQGYEVFRNISQHGPSDLIIYNPETNVFTPVDVKTGSTYTTKNGVIVKRGLRTEKQRAMGVRFLHVFPNNILWDDQLDINPET